MISENQYSSFNASIVENWLQGWALTRKVSPPVKEDNSGFRIDVGWPQQKIRYVFPSITDEFKSLAATIIEPWVFLKVCAHPDLVIKFLPPRWVLQPLGYMMVCFTPMLIRNTDLPSEYSLDIIDEGPITIIKIFTKNEQLGAIGRIAFVKGFAIYDRIETHPAHRRKGLATIIMKTLETIAIRQGKTKGLLVATQEGRLLYEALGWQMHAFYTSAVIPDTF